MKKIAIVFYTLLLTVIILFFTFRDNETITEIDLEKETFTNADLDSALTNEDNLYKQYY